MNCKILKLSNGEELIADVQEDSEKYIINNPMVFLTSSMIDDNGIPVDVTFMKDWLNNSDIKTIELNKDRVVAVTTASKKCIHHYTLEKEKFEADMKMKNELTDKEYQQFMNDIDNMVSKFIESQDEPELPFEDETPFEELERMHKRRKKRRKRKKQTNSSLIPEELQDRPMIYLNMVIPPEALMNLITSGIIDPEILQVMIDEVKKKAKFTGDEKNRKDFGNKFSDWNPDPKSDDYL